MSETQIKTTFYASPRAGRLALLTIDNGADHRKPTVLGVAALDSLDAALDEVEAQGDVKALLVTGKPFIFVAGADLKAFVGATPEFARTAGRRGQEVFGRLRDLPVPTLAAINGACLGGGLELALHCDYRTLSTNAAPIGFPEVFLSIFPAWGGTQLAPRLLGTARALELIVANPLANNKTVRAAQAYELGLADRLLAPVDLLDASVALLERLVTGEERIDRSAPSDNGVDEAVAATRRLARERVHGSTRAPFVAIDLVEHAARGGDLAEGLRAEQDALTELLPARQAQAAVYSFDLTQRRVARQPWRPDVPGRQIRTLGIVGAGLMGAQLGAYALHRLEVPVALKDIDADVLDRARAHIEEALDKRVTRGRLAPSKAAFLKSVVTYTLDDEPLAGSDLVVEAVAEDLDLKRRILADVEAVVDPACVLATNTSALSVSAMAADLDHPERVVGLHFFNPVEMMPLVEVVATPSSSDQALATAFDVAKALRKSAVACSDAPGFVVNRLLTRFMLASGEAVTAGNDFTEVDDALKEELGLPMGTFELLGLVGPVVAAHVARRLHEAFPDRFPLDPNFELLAASGLPGVYDWQRGRVPFDAVREGWQRASEPRPLSAEQIRTRALEAVADEIRHLLDDGVVADARDVDTCMLLGAGWPFHMGGICHYLDATGVSQRLFGAPLLAAADRAA